MNIGEHSFYCTRLYKIAVGSNVNKCSSDINFCTPISKLNYLFQIRWIRPSYPSSLGFSTSITHIVSVINNSLFTTLSCFHPVTSQISRRSSTEEPVTKLISPFLKLIILVPLDAALVLFQSLTGVEGRKKYQSPICNPSQDCRSSLKPINLSNRNTTNE